MPVALITGTRHGIGRGASLALAAAGFDIALGDVEDGATDDLAERIAERGRSAMTVDIDLLDHARLASAVDAVHDAFGRVDVLFHNAHAMGSDLAPMPDVTLAEIERHVAANTFAPLLLAARVLPGMTARGGGTLIFRGSGIGMKDPTLPPGRGGWGIAAAVANGALHRIAGVVHNEYADRGIRAFTLLPGFVLTDVPPQHRPLDDAGLLPGRRQTGGTGVVPEAAVANVVAWLATSDDATRFAGGLVDAAIVAVEHRLHPPWDLDGG